MIDRGLSTAPRDLVRVPARLRELQRRKRRAVLKAWLAWGVSGVGILWLVGVALFNGAG
jgi:hypothetical protein